MLRIAHRARRPVLRLAGALAGTSALAATALLTAGPASAATAAPAATAYAVLEQPGQVAQQPASQALLARQARLASQALLARAAVPAAVPKVKVGDRHCTNVTSQSNFKATICLEIRSQVHGRGETLWPEVTYKVNSGGILEDYAQDLFFIECDGFTGGCSNGDVSKILNKFPAKHPGSTDIIGKPVNPTPGVPISFQAAGTELCIDWTNFQAACDPGTLKSAS
jgi:hypothetical protein